MAMFTLCAELILKSHKVRSFLSLVQMVRVRQQLLKSWKALEPEILEQSQFWALILKLADMNLVYGEIASELSCKARPMPVT
jgi:hypothetical protein